MAKYTVGEFEAVNEESRGIPSYLIAADTHNIANGNESFFTSAANSLENAPKFIAASLISGANQLYNIAPSIGNLFGGDFELSDAADVMQRLDSNLGDYYSDNKQFTDVAGFLVSSLIPGLGGVKLLNAGQAALKGAVGAGKVGSNIAGAVNLLTPSQPALLKAAVEAAVSPNAATAVWNPNTLKAVAATFTQNTLEGVAFTTAVEATMFKSPVLDTQTVGDIASNIMWGGILQGGLGGVFGTAGIANRIYKELRTVAKTAAPVTHRAVATETAYASDKIITYMQDSVTTPILQEGEYTAKFASLREQKLRNIDVDIRSEFSVLTGADQDLASVWYNNYKIHGVSQTESALFGSTTFTRLGVQSAEETKLLKLLGKAELSPEELAYVNTHAVTYIKNFGADAHTVTLEAPAIFSVADSLKSGQQFSAALKEFKHTRKSAWDPLTTSPLQAEARYITAIDSKLVPTDIIRHNDLPYLQAAMEQGVLPQIKLADGSTWIPASSVELRAYILNQKELIATELVTKGIKSEAAAKIVDATEDWLGTLRHPSDENAFALRYAADTYTQQLQKAGLIKPDDYVRTWELPTYTKRVQDLTPIVGVDGMVLEGMAAIKQKEVLYIQQATTVADSVLPQEVKFSPISDKVMLTANPRGPGGSAISAKNENFGQLGSIVQYNGQQTLKAIKLAESDLLATAQPVLYKAMSKPESLLEFSVLNSRLSNIPEQYILDVDGVSLKLAKEARYEAAIAAGKKLPPPVIAADIPKSIPIKNQETLELVKYHISRNSTYVQNLGKIRAQQGLKFERDPEAFYPIPRNPKDFKFFGFVVDDSITGSFGRNKMIHATDAADLEFKITELKKLDPTLKIFTGKEAEAYYKAIGQFDFERTLTDMSFDSSLRRTGRGAEVTPMTDPDKIMDMFLGWHKARTANGVREAVLLRFEPQVKTLNKLGENFSSIQQSHYSALDALSQVQNAAGNPYTDYVKTLLGLSTNADYPVYTALNELLDKKISSLFNSVYETFYSTTAPADLLKINNLMREYGYEGPAYSALMNTLANHTAPKQVLTDFVRKANAVLGTIMLRLDPINALNNIVGSNVLLSAETRHVLSLLDEDAVGELAKIAVPGTTNTILSPGKLIAKSMARFHSDEGKQLRELYKARGYITSISDQYMETLSGLAIKGTETPAQLEAKLTTVVGKLKSWASAGEKLTGNTFAEEFNRFVAADVMKQITDVAVSSGKLNPDEAWAYINTFVNRTQGNYIASQRPGMFSGPIGQAIGLFQTYQFNFLQQLLRYVGDGSVKNASTLLGMQASIYGLNGLPAFNAINTHIIGNAAGNTNHTDTYDVVYGTVGKSAGDWLMYGAGSNVWGLLDPSLKLNLYTRGDINPRHLTVVPTNPADVPFIAASAKFFKSLESTASKISLGGNVWTSILQGIEHSGINRPLAGLAQTFEATANPMNLVYSTSNKGNVIAANDLWSITTAIRLSGAKPFDEALAIDRAYNLSVYATKDAVLRKSLGAAIKTTIQAGKQVTEDQILDFSKQYAAYGGRQEKFTHFFMDQVRSANTSQVNEIASHLAKPSAQSMQRLMGGYNLRDFTND